MKALFFSSWMRLFVFSSLSVFFVGLGSGCASSRAGATPDCGCARSSSPSVSAVESSPANAAQDLIWVASPDGSLSCSPGSGRSLEEDAKELKQAGVEVLASEKRNDGKMRIQMCGAPTGSLNAFKIPKSSLSKAEKLGFKAQ